MKRTKQNCGFTLMELVVVLAVIAILAAILTPTITSYVERARLNAARTDVRSIAAGIVQFNTDTKIWPIYSALPTSDLNDTTKIFFVQRTDGNDATIGAGTGWNLTTAANLDEVLNRNSLSLTGTGNRAWKGPYVDLGPDPWGGRYYVTSANLRPASTDAAYVLSPGPNQIIETNYSQARNASGGFVVGADDIVQRIR